MAKFQRLLVMNGLIESGIGLLLQDPLQSCDSPPQLFPMEEIFEAFPSFLSTVFESALQTEPNGIYLVAQTPLMNHNLIGMFTITKKMKK